MAKKTEIKVAKMKDDFLEDLPFMLKEYANGQDNEMTVGARELKAELIRILNENGWQKEEPKKRPLIYKCDTCGAEYTDVPMMRGPNLTDCPQCNPKTRFVDGIWIKTLGPDFQE